MRTLQEVKSMAKLTNCDSYDRFMVCAIIEYVVTAK